MTSLIPCHCDCTQIIGFVSVQCRAHWAMYDPASTEWQEGLPCDISKTLKRRYFLVEKAKNASVIGNTTLTIATHTNLPAW